MGNWWNLFIGNNMIKERKGKGKVKCNVFLGERKS